MTRRSNLFPGAPPQPPSMSEPDMSPKIGMNEFLSSNPQELRKAGSYVETAFRAWVKQNCPAAFLSVAQWKEKVAVFIGNKKLPEQSKKETQEQTQE